MCRFFGLHAGRRAVTATFSDPPAHLLHRDDLTSTAQAAQRAQ